MLVLVVGCRYGLPGDEIRDMSVVQQGWEKIVLAAEEKFQSISDKHEAFMAELRDTSNWARRAQIQQDTALRLQIHRLSGSYEGAKRRHIYNLKEMRTFLVTSEVWLQRVNSEITARQLARRSWQARTETFKTLYRRLEATQAAFDEITPHYARITRLLPSLAAVIPGQP